MNHPLVFRIVFGALCLLALGVGTTYRVTAQSGRKIDYSNASTEPLAGKSELSICMIDRVGRLGVRKDHRIGSQAGCNFRGWGDETAIA